MTRSMTGYGRGEAVLHERSITVELRSVNNRYLDCSVKIPRSFIFAEDKIKSHVQEKISRGKVDVFVTLDSAKAEKISVRINEAVADAYYKALGDLCQRYELKNDISPALLSRFPDVFITEKDEEDLELVAEDILTVLDMATEDFNAMRSREGKKLSEDILSRGEKIQELLKVVETRAPETVLEYRAKLTKRMEDVLKNTQLDETRILMEAALYGDKIAVDEETVRLRSHLSQLEEILTKGGIVGRKLDFLIQEFNREANTIGSKSGDVEITKAVLEIKGEIEKIREQVQNME